MSSLAQIDSDDRFGFEIGDVETLRIYSRESMALRTLRASISEE